MKINPLRSARKGLRFLKLTLESPTSREINVSYNPITKVYAQNIACYMQWHSKLS